MVLTLAGGGCRRSVGLSLISLCLSVAILMLFSVPGHAQPPGAPAGQRPGAGQAPQGKLPTKPPTGRRPGANSPPAPKPKEEEIKPPAPESSYLRTKDGWSIYCTYYGPMEGVRSGKEVVPIILLHGWGGQGAEYRRFAYMLQTIGCAVMVPDLRAHGRSTSCRLPDRRTQELKDEEIKYDELERRLPNQPNGLNGIVYDIEAVKKVLMDRHNKAELNIEMLCVGGAEEGALVAINWAAMDWSWPVTPSYKQGQDVKGLILLSPEQRFKKLNSTDALRRIAVTQRISVMVAVGEEDRQRYSDAKRIYRGIERERETYTDPAEKARKQNCFFFEAPTLYQGSKLLDPQLKVYKYVGMFLKLRFFDKAEEYPWFERKSPL